MDQKTEPLFIFRVLIEWSNDYNVFVARCLETGNVATASSTEVAEDMIKELLIDEVTFAVNEDNIENLYSSPAPLEIWMRYRSAVQQGVSSKPMQRAIRATNEEVPAEIQVARSR
jgi:predicted RNase H-like HicB family nuclease